MSSTGSVAMGEASPADDRFEGLVERVSAALGDAVVATELVHANLCVRVDRAAWRRVAEVAKAEFGCEYFCFLSGVDWLPNPELSGEKSFDAPPGTPAADEGADDDEAGAGDTADQPHTMTAGQAGGDARFQVFARLHNVREGWGVTFKADLDEADPRVESWTPVYRGADWHERETWEMYGFTFDGHPGLRHMYLPGEFEGYPLRKDFPLLAREVKPWPGIVDVEPLPGEAGSTDGAQSATSGGDETSEA